MAENNNNFLQSDIWRQFQEAVGHKTFIIKEGNFWASIIEHQLPVVGKYFYIPRWPLAGIFNFQFSIFNELIKLAKKEGVGWIRIEPENNQGLELIKNNISLPIKKAPHDMQPREILVMNISKSEEELLSGMKSKTRYNINLAQKRGVLVKVIFNDQNRKYYIDKFVKLVNLTAKRKGIEFHPENYYRKTLEMIPGDILKLYVAEYEGKVIAANLMIFHGDTATYLHGATDDEYRNVMAPYLLQWQAIQDAKKAGCVFYDFGGVKTQNMEQETWNKNDWSGITKFKLGFTPKTEPISFPGSFDLIINRRKYFIYRITSRLINTLSMLRR